VTTLGRSAWCLRIRSAVFVNPSLTTMAVKPSIVFVLGGPGSGKGTQCSIIEKRLGFKHISAGDCLREERISPNSAYGDLIESCIRHGSIVPVSVTCMLLKNKMQQLGWEGGKFLIDGFPRNRENFEGWNTAMGDLVEVKFCLFLDCPEEIMEKRLVSRGKTSGRVDDEIAVIRKRFDTYTAETTPVVMAFQSDNKCRLVDSCQSVEAVWETVRQIFVNEFGDSLIDSSSSKAASVSLSGGCNCGVRV